MTGTLCTELMKDNPCLVALKIPEGLLLCMVFIQKISDVSIILKNGFHKASPLGKK